MEIARIYYSIVDFNFTLNRDYTLIKDNFLSFNLQY